MSTTIAVGIGIAIAIAFVVWAIFGGGKDD